MRRVLVAVALLGAFAAIGMPLGLRIGTLSAADNFPSPGPTPPGPEWLTFTATRVEPGHSVYVGMTEYGDDPEEVSLELSTNGVDWAAYEMETYVALPVAGSRAMFRAGTNGNERFCHRDEGSAFFSGCHFFTSGDTDGDISVSGNVNSLLDSDYEEVQISRRYAFASLFLNCSGIRSTSMSLPSVVLMEGCYMDMFNGCSSLTNAPSLPAEGSANDCYARMFAGCRSLKETPYLHAIALNLAERCYERMFGGCSSLERASMRYANGSKSSNFTGMFFGVPESGTLEVFGDDPRDDVGSGGFVPSGWTVIMR